MQILIVEDDPISLLVVQRVLTQLGHEVTTAKNGAEALDMLLESPFGIVISDWMMPEMDGLELCRRIRAEQESTDSYTYFILLTSRNGNEDRRDALASGADDVLPKSLDPEDLLARLTVAERILARQQRLRGRAESLLEKQTELSSINVNLSEQVTVDSLTGLKNHRAFFDELERCYAFSVRHGAPLSVMLIDVDNFKAFNDSHGHMAGDDVLRTVAHLLRGSLRTHDYVARYGGEEFAVILPVTDTDNAMILAERLRTLIETHPWNVQPVTACFGVSGYSLETSNAEALVHEADRAMYYCKNHGRNCSFVYNRKLMGAEAKPLVNL